MCVRVLSHLDADDTAERVRHVYTVILYLTTGAQSTAFPTYKANEFALPHFASERTDAAVLNAVDMQRTAALGLLNDHHYASWPVEAGDMVLFSQATMHYGTANPIETPRQALFSILTPFADVRQDNHQIFRYDTQAAHTVRPGRGGDVPRSAARR